MTTQPKSIIVPGKHKDDPEESVSLPETLQAQRFQESNADPEEAWQSFRDENVSPPGAIPNISPLLEARRLKYQLPDQFFAAYPANNKVYVFQIEDEEEGKYGGKDGVIHMPDQVKERRAEAAPKGIIVGAGLKAMDHMYANGYWIGHVVSFICMNPWRKPIATVGGKALHVMVMTAGDICDDYDLSACLKDGVVKHAYREYELDDGTKKREHYLQDTKTGEVWDPSTVEMTEGEANG